MCFCFQEFYRPQNLLLYYDDEETGWDAVYKSDKVDSHKFAMLNNHITMFPGRNNHNDDE